jgi:hypothetical protein
MRKLCQPVRLLTFVDIFLLSIRLQNLNFLKPLKRAKSEFSESLKRTDTHQYEAFTPLLPVALLTSSCMLTPIAVNFAHHLSPDAPACFPCTMPDLVSTPAPNRFLHRFNATHVQRSAQRCAEVAQERPSWPRCRVRALVARELNVSTAQLRYLLRQAATQAQPTPDADAPELAA